MRTGLILGEKSFAFRDVPERQLREGGAIVDITLCGICGSDVSAYKSGAPYPHGLCGHEWTGVVRAIAADIPGISEGTRVVCSGPGPCITRCSACLQGRYEACATVVKSILGDDGFSPDSGGFAPTQLVDATRLLPVPPSLTDMQAAMVEPATVATRSVRRSGIKAGDRIAVVGAGPIGLFAIQAVRAAGAELVIAIDPDARRGKVAVELGAHYHCPPGDEAEALIRELTDGLGVDKVFECSGAPPAIQASAAYARQRGTVILVGVSAKAVSIEPVVFVLKELDVVTSVGFDKADTLSVLGMMQSGLIRTDPLYSETIALGQTGVAIAELAAGSEKIKILVDTRG